MSKHNNLTVTGVDFGSSSVKIAAILKGGVQVIVNQANFRQTPNVVGFGQKQRLIGEAGQVKIKSNHTNTVLAPSRLLGFNRACHYLDEQLKFCPVRPKKSQSEQQGLKFNIMYGSQRQNFTAQQLVAAYITQIQKIIGYTNSLLNKNMVISVPTYFTQHQRKALLDAVQITKKKMNCQYQTQLVNQQVAISMDYGFSKRNDFSEDLQKSKKVLFIDFGHSKASAFVTSFNKQHMKIEASKFQRQLGCKFMDQELVKFYAKIFDLAHPNMQLNLLQNRKSVLKLVQNVEKQRKVLSGNFEHDLSIQCLMEDEDIYYLMKRDQYQKICAPVITKFKKLLNDFANQLKQKGIKFQSIELIGGGTRIPSIINAISEVFSQEPFRTINSNQCIARGAALVSAMNSSIFRIQPYVFFSISPYVINLMVNKQNLGTKLLQCNQILMKNNTVQFEVNKTLEKFILSAQYENIQKGIQSRIFQSEIYIISKERKTDQNNSQMKEEENENNKIGLKLTFNIDQNGLIKFEQIISNNSSFVVKFQKMNYFPKFRTQQLHQMQQKQKVMAINDQKMKKFYQKKNEYQAQIYRNKHNIQNFLSENCQYISEQNRSEMRTLMQAEQNWLGSHLEGSSDIKIEDLTNRSEQMNKKMQQTFKLANHSKQSHTSVNAELKKLSNFLNQVMSKRKQNEYPQQVNSTGKWLNQMFQQQKQEPKYNPAVLTVQQIKQVYQGVVQKINEFDQQMQRQRQANLRKGQQPRNYGSHYGSHYGNHYESPSSTYNQFGGLGGRPAYESNQYKPNTTRNNRSGYSANTNTFGSVFGNNGFL